jgi:ATP adenylyltransferase
MTEPDCPICAKHCGEGPLLGGPLVYSNEHILVFHRPPYANGATVAGYLFVETRRHVPYLDQLSDTEARAVGWAVSRAARALRSELFAEHVFSAIVGTGVAHFHQHLFARHPGTPSDVAWIDSDDWAGAPRVAGAELAELGSRLAVHFG